MLLLRPADSLVCRYVPGRSSEADCLGHLHLKCAHRYLSHYDTHSNALGHQTEARKEDRRDHCARCRRVCPYLLSSEDYLRYSGKSQ